MWGEKMSVLSELVHQREDWAERRRCHANVTVALEYAFVVAMGVFLYFYHDRVFTLVESLLN